VRRRRFLAILPTLYLLPAAATHAAPPLVEAAKAGDTATVTALLAAGADPDAHDAHRNTGLTFAARDGRLEIAHALIAAGATLDWRDGERVTPLILAAHKNRPALARLLLDQGADTAIRDQWGRTALDYAQRRGPDDPIAMMIRAATDRSSRATPPQTRSSIKHQLNQKTIAIFCRSTKTK
jgi:ankyrin repeat protein